MKLKYLTSTFLLSAASLLGQTLVTVHSEDFESGGGNLNSGNANMMSFGVVADPADAGNSVGEGNVGGGNSQWGAVNAVPQIINLPNSVEPGVSTFSVSMRVYIPSGTTYAVGGSGADRMGIILRWNGIQSGSSNQYLEYDTFAFDTWQLFEHTGTIPTADGDGTPVSTVLPIISFNDRDNDAADGVAAYIDDYKIEVSVSADDPNLPVGTEFSFGDVEQNGGAVTKEIILSNSGTTQDLTITSATLGGTNVDLFSLEELTFPLTLTPGAEQRVTIDLDPGDTVGGLFGTLEIASNDASEGTITINLSGNSVEPFEGREFILNGDFEELAEGSTDLVSWRNNARLTSSTDFARSGTNSAVFNLAGMNQWGDARFEHLDEPIPDSITITPDMYGKDYFYSAWYLTPATGGMADNDDVRAILRWNGFNGATNHIPGGILTVGSMPKEIWTRVAGGSTIPSEDINGDPVTHLTILWSYQDVNADAAGGELMYLDDVTFKIDAPLIEPEGDPVITSILHDLENDIVTLTYEGTANVTFAIDRSTGLTAEGQPTGWMELSDNETADSTTRTYTDFGAPSTSTKFFYRVRVPE
ncbi:choice-of-anchor D domain-containing protein [Akkermansiaceae bacterium]|nr:choice-of-anchor D domain-containing protein [Akkermansiaceae bacterium]MDB4626672.1 choice-of-anchor D domain-containing protein [Akkermansiaceae bacterium]MDB4781499.1 choice-of-anchor D domain-containing protein [Akkermansiaceae bacterium]